MMIGVVKDFKGCPINGSESFGSLSLPSVLSCKGSGGLVYVSGHLQLLQLAELVFLRSAHGKLLGN